MGKRQHEKSNNFAHTTTVLQIFIVHTVIHSVLPMFSQTKFLCLTHTQNVRSAHLSNLFLHSIICIAYTTTIFFFFVDNISYVIGPSFVSETQGGLRKPEAEFLSVIGTKVLKVFLLAIHSYLYLRIFLPPPPPFNLGQMWFETG
jgi:hypothetical protein